MQHYRTSASRETGDGDCARITTKWFYMLLDPFERELLIKQTGIHDSVAKDLIRREETESTQLCGWLVYILPVQEFPYTILYAYSNEAIVIRIDHFGLILLAIEEAIATSMYPLVPVNQSR
jgi:hypothetical protein